MSTSGRPPPWRSPGHPQDIPGYCMGTPQDIPPSPWVPSGDSQDTPGHPWETHMAHSGDNPQNTPTGHPQAP